MVDDTNSADRWICDYSDAQRWFDKYGDIEADCIITDRYILLPIKERKCQCKPGQWYGDKYRIEICQYCLLTL